MYKAIIEEVTYEVDSDLPINARLIEREVNTIEELVEELNRCKDYAKIKEDVDMIVNVDIIDIKKESD